MIKIFTKPPTTPEELSAMPDAANYELVDGQLVERNVSTLSCLVESMVHARIFSHAQQGKLGPVWTGTMGFACFPDRPKKVRRPDVSFVKAERMTPELMQTGYLPIAPDLAVEVISPGDLAHEVAEKIEEYMHAGVSLIWVIEPELRLVDVYRKNGVNTRLRETDELLGEDVLPGFHCRIAELFPEAAPTSATS
jgi:Uma2 family endonuclease